MMAFSFPTKKAAKAAIGTDVTRRFIETSMFGPEFKGAGTYTVVGPAPYERKWYAQVTVDADGVLLKVK